MTKRELKKELEKRDNQLKQLMLMVEELTKKVDTLSQKSSVENHYHYHTQMPYYVPPLILPCSQPQPPLTTPQPIVTTWCATQTNNNNMGEENCLLPVQGLKCNGDSISGLTAVSVSPVSFTH